MPCLRAQLNRFETDNTLGLMPSSDGGDDFIGVGYPGFDVGVVIAEEAVDGRLNSTNRSEDASIKTALSSSHVSGCSLCRGPQRPPVLRDIPGRRWIQVLEEMPSDRSSPTRSRCDGTFWNQKKKV
jgi:hypothetical protein